VTPAFAYPPEIRRVLTTTNAIESLNMQLRTIIKTRGHFPTEEAAAKLLHLALRNIKKRWVPAPHRQLALAPESLSPAGPPDFNLARILSSPTTIPSRPRRKRPPPDFNLPQTSSLPATIPPRRRRRSSPLSTNPRPFRLFSRARRGTCFIPISQDDRHTAVIRGKPIPSITFL
jgi:hypothetical protein